MTIPKALLLALFVCLEPALALAGGCQWGVQTYPAPGGGAPCDACDPSPRCTTAPSGSTGGSTSGGDPQLQMIQSMMPAIQQGVHDLVWGTPEENRRREEQRRKEALQRKAEEQERERRLKEAQAARQREFEADKDELLGGLKGFDEEKKQRCLSPAARRRLEARRKGQADDEMAQRQEQLKKLKGEQRDWCILHLDFIYPTRPIYVVKDEYAAKLAAYDEKKTEWDKRCGGPTASPDYVADEEDKERLPDCPVVAQRVQGVQRARPVQAQDAELQLKDIDAEPQSKTGTAKAGSLVAEADAARAPLKAEGEQSAPEPATTDEGETAPGSAAGDKTAEGDKAAQDDETAHHGARVDFEKGLAIDKLKLSKNRSRGPRPQPSAPARAPRPQGSAPATLAQPGLLPSPAPLDPVPGEPDASPAQPEEPPAIAEERQAAPDAGAASGAPQTAPAAEPKSSRTSWNQIGMQCNGTKSDGYFNLDGQDNSQAAGSPGLNGAPTFASGNKTRTVWGLGWFSENDQMMELNQDRSLTWTDGQGNRFTFPRVKPAAPNAAPAYGVPDNFHARLAVASVANGTPTAITLRGLDGTTLIFSAAESAAILRLVRLKDRNGNTLDFARDGKGRLKRVTDIHGRFFALTYDGAGLVASVSDQAKRTYSYAYDDQGRRVKESGPLGTTAYAYDSLNRMTTVTYANGGVRNYTYDSQNRVLTEDDGNGSNRITYAYTPLSTTMTDSSGRSIKHEFIMLQGQKMLSRATDPSGGKTSFTYDDDLNLTSQTNPMGRVTRYTYDRWGNVVAAQDAAGGLAKASYEPVFNQVTSLTDPLGRSTSLSYDSKGNLKQLRDPLSFVTRMAVDRYGHLSRFTDPTGASATFTYEPSNGALASMTDPLDRATTLRTDPLSRVVEAKDPSGKRSQYSYDQAGDLLQAADALGHKTGFSYALGRAEKLPTSVKDALGNATSFRYDDLGRVISVTNALGQGKAAVYDAQGRVIQTKNARGQAIAYAYDALDRLTTKTLPEGAAQYAYDAAGNLRGVKQPNRSAMSAAYDALDRATIVEQTLPGGFSATIGYSYDANGNRTGMTTPWGDFSYQYDADDRLAQLTNAQGKTFTFAYDPAGRRASLSAPNGVAASYVYDAAGQLLSLTHTRVSDGAVIASAAYEYDQAGNRTSMTDGSGIHRYGYDELHRLTSASHPAASGLPILDEAFSYDAVGNRLADARLRGYRYDAANRLLGNNRHTYTYDADGNLVGKTDRGTQSRVGYAYDSVSQLVKVSLPGASVAAKYDAGGRRVEMSVNAETFRYVYDGARVLAILDKNNKLVALFTNGPGLAEPLGMRRDGKDFFYHADALGSVTALTDGNGSVVETYQYQAFGRAGVKDGSGAVHDRSQVGNPFLFAGTEYDPGTGLYHMGFRYLDPDTGRWTQEDPIGFAGGDVNLYVYAGGNPVLNTDPSGLAILIYDRTVNKLFVYSNEGKLLHTYEAHNDVIRGKTPAEPGLYHIGPPRGPREEGTIIENITTGRWFIPFGDPADAFGIHGGGSCAKGNAYDAYQGWCKTLGCIRVQNASLESLVQFVRNDRKRGKQNILLVNPGWYLSAVYRGPVFSQGGPSIVQGPY